MRHHDDVSLMRVALLVVAAFVAAPAQAGDGVLEINQACVATGCFAGDSPGFPVTLPTASSYRLTSNLVVPTANTTAVQILEGGTSLDLGGFAIRGPTVCTGEPVTSCTPTGSGVGIEPYAGRNRIFNGAVEGMGASGIAPGGDSRLWDLTVSHNGATGVFLSRGDSVRNSTVTFNGEVGIRGNTGGGFGEVAGCTVRGNAGHGVHLSGGLVVDSRMQNNGGAGLSGSPGYHGNVITGNTTPGVSSADAIGCNAIDGNAVCPP